MQQSGSGVGKGVCSGGGGGVGKGVCSGGEDGGVVCGWGICKNPCFIN